MSSHDNISKLQPKVWSFMIVFLFSAFSVILLFILKLSIHNEILMTLL